MKKINWAIFFRKDLNLQDKWWHRLLSIIFILSFILFISFNIVDFSTHDIFRGGQVNQWKKVSSLSDRITSDIKPISALLKTSEKIGDNNRTYVLNDEPDEYYRIILNDVYCSTELVDDYKEIESSRNIGELYIMENNYRKKITSEVFSNYIRQNEIKCLIVDAYSSPNNKSLSFLQPDRSYQDNWTFYQKSTTKTLLYFLEMIPIVLGISLIIFLGIIIIYYKVVLYVIFGNKRITKN